jgi:hypothetical protein
LAGSFAGIHPVNRVAYPEHCRSIGLFSRLRCGLQLGYLTQAPDNGDYVNSPR